MNLVGYSCVTCNQFFENKVTLRKHEKKMHGEERDENIVPECNVCKKKFMTLEQLKEHKKVHTKARMECVICKRVVQRNNLSRHRRSRVCKNIWKEQIEQEKSGNGQIEPQVDENWPENGGNRPDNDENWLENGIFERNAPNFL